MPVNYAMDNETVVFRTGPGSKLAGLRTQPLSFEVDDHDPYRCTGWSVLIRGVAFEIEERDAREDPVPWAPGEKAHWVRVMPMEITGRRISWVGPIGRRPRLSVIVATVVGIDGAGTHWTGRGASNVRRVPRPVVVMAAVGVVARPER